MNLDDLEAMLLDGIRQSRQTSLGRRMPRPAALPALARVRQALREFVIAQPTDERGWRLLSLAEETMLGYPKALKAMERALEFAGRRDKNDLKRLGALRTAALEWNELRLSAVELASLAEALDAAAELEADFAVTRQWLGANGRDAAEIDRVISVFERRGARCDEDVAEIAHGRWV